jgi:tRNA(adenine34) deaminase
MTDCTCNACARLDRRAALGGLLAAGVVLTSSRPAFARAALKPARVEDEGFMRLALAQAAQGDFPFGAVIEKNGRVLASGRNSGKRLNDPTAHGEMMAIRAFVAAHPAEEMKGATIYTTGESCPMCMGAIIWCGFGRIVYGASIEELSKHIGQIMIDDKTIAAAAPFTDVEITGGVLAKEALALFSR